MRCGEEGCGRPTTVFHTETMEGHVVRRRRKCGSDHVTTTYERLQGDTNSPREQVIVNIYRELGPEDRRAFWSVLNRLGVNDGA